jgi:Leucine-rich repeat (LRR) protein
MKTRTLLIAIFLLLANLCRLSSQETQNPLSLVAEYNLESEGGFATGDPQTAYGGLFRFLSLPQIKVPQGYHIPTKEELMVISGRYNSDEKPNPPYPDLSWEIDRGADEEVILFGEKQTLNSHYYGKGEYVCYALRFKGGDNRYLSAYKWEPIFFEGDTQKVKTKALKVTCRLLGAEGIGLKVEDIAKPEYWESNAQNDVVRYFPTAGYTNYNDEEVVMGRNMKGRYWSLTSKDINGAWGFGFDADFVMVYSWIYTAGYSVRCFKDKVPVIPEPTTDATCQMSVAKLDAPIEVEITGPSEVEVDWGDGVRHKVVLSDVGGKVSGNVIGSKFSIYANHVLSLKANSQNLSEVILSNCEELEILELGFNKLENLSLKGLTNLKRLNVVNNRIRQLDVTPAKLLQYLSVSKNFYIKDLALDKLLDLEELYIATNDISTIDLSKNTKLRILDLSKNKELETIDLSTLTSLEDLSIGRTAISSLDLSHNQSLVRLYADGNRQLSELCYSSLSRLLSCYLSKCALGEQVLNKLISDLPNVSDIFVYANERVWKKQLELSENVDVVKERLALDEARGKGWKIDLLDEAWSMTPRNPCMILTTAIPVNEEITWTVDNYYDPFWVDWGQWWSSFLQSKPHVITHAVRQPEIQYYSRGLMEIRCPNQKLTKAEFPNNDQTYLIDLHDNELTSLLLGANNSIVNLDIRNNKLNGEALDQIFSSLRILREIQYPFPIKGYESFPSNIECGKICIAGNPGAIACDTSIATQKGYTVDLSTGIEETHPGDSSTYCYPNPAHDVIYLGSTAGFVELFSYDGVLVLTAQDVSMIDISTLPEGPYVLRVNGTTLRKVSIIH